MHDPVRPIFGGPLLIRTVLADLFSDFYLQTLQDRVTSKRPGVSVIFGKSNKDGWEVVWKAINKIGFST